jgi:hypothetical protein
VKATVWKVPLGQQPGSDLELPDVILGYLGNDPTKKTVKNAFSFLNKTDRWAYILGVHLWSY